jgi:hypothetical protein
MGHRRVVAASSVEAGVELAPGSRIVCERCENLAGRAADVNGEVKMNGSRVEKVEIDGFAGEHTNLLAL